MIEEKVWNDRGSQAPDKATAVIPLPEDSYHNTVSANLILCPLKRESSINQCNHNNSCNIVAQMSVITARLYHIMKGSSVWFSGCYLYIPLLQVRSVLLLSVPLKRIAVTSDPSTGGFGLQECAGGGDGPLQSEQISTKRLYVQSAWQAAGCTASHNVMVPDCPVNFTWS